MSYKLVKFQADYADEFDVYGFRIMSDKEYKEFKQMVDTSKYPIEKSFGTNEQIFFSNVVDVDRSLSVSIISGKEADRLETIFGETWGWFPEFEE